MNRSNILYIHGFELRDRHKHLARTLRSAGYHTALTGVHHAVRDPLICGYQQWIRTSGRGTGAIVDAAVGGVDARDRRPAAGRPGPDARGRGLQPSEDVSPADVWQYAEKREGFA